MNPRHYGPSRVYLCGPINGRSDADCKNWRNYAAERLRHSAEVVDPMVRDYRGRESNVVREIVENDKNDIDTCDTLLVYYDKPSVGTSMEVLYAFERSKLIVLVNASDTPLSPWLQYHATVITQSLDAALDYIVAAKCVVLSSGRNIVHTVRS